MSDSSSSTPRSPKRKSRRKKGRGGDGSSGGSDASDGASSSSDRSGVSSGDESGGDAGPSPAELRARAAARAASLSRDLAAKYNKLRHTVEHLKHHLAERRVQLPVVHLLPEQTADGLLTAAKSRAAPKDSPAWVAWLIAWESEHFRPAEARCHLLLQLKADLRCLSRVLLSAKVPPSERKQRAAEKEEEEGDAITRGEGKALDGGERGRGERGEIRWTGAPLRKPQYHPSKVSY